MSQHIYYLFASEITWLTIPKEQRGRLLQIIDDTMVLSRRRKIEISVVSVDNKLNYTNFGKKSRSSTGRYSTLYKYK